MIGEIIQTVHRTMIDEKTAALHTSLVIVEEFMFQIKEFGAFLSRVEEVVPENVKCVVV